MSRRDDSVFAALALVLLSLVVAAYWSVFHSLYIRWTMADSYYSHGPLIPIVSLFFLWKDRKGIAAIPRSSSPLGVPVVIAAATLLLMSDFLGFVVFGEFSLVVMLVGVSLILCGAARTRRMWFPLFFLLFMVPIPASVTQSVTFKLKIIAAESAVSLAKLFTLPMVREGSFIHFGDDKLLVGDICGGLRSLIALLALGTLVAYISPVKTWAKIALVVLAGPVAVVANIARIFFLCVVGYLYGSEVAAGKVHDYSGILIFAVAIGLFLMVEAPLRRWAAGPESDEQESGDTAAPLPGGLAWLAIGVMLVAATAGGHAAIARAQAQAAETAGEQIHLDIPARIVDYHQAGADAEIDDRTRELLETSLILVRDYATPRQNRRIQLTIVHAGTTRRSLHFPEVCIVGSGFEIRDQYTAPVGVLFNARRLVLVQGDYSEAVMYWFKTGDSFTGNFFVNAGYWAVNQLMLKTPTSSLIKLTTPIGPDGEAAAFNALADFTAKLTPELRGAIR